ncbi:protein unc-93 homolog a [Plakobranchus ocellatus]|uniref:Protein unc-93 homolog a n=1 Tax=Plakobranchus ocellatus TaxID=259542 RepID=A0AAV4CPL7_9GAST|nr:protein unc-93 homolog a [Plakobranchus ocellatus]
MPSSDIHSLCMEHLMHSRNIHSLSCAFSYSKRASSSPYNILSRFNSLFFGVLATTQITGNLITSTVIRDGVGNISETIVYEFCGANDCPANENATEIHDPATWVIDTTLGVLLGCALLGLVLVVVLLVPLPRNEVVQGVTLRDRLLVYFRVVMTTNMILLAPFMLFSSVQHAFLVSVFTKAYVACPIGIHNVGFVMASYGATTPVFMAIFGQLARVTGRFLLLVASLVTNLILLVILFNWAPTADDEVVMYVVAIVWGLVESILLAQANALIAMLYPEDKEAAFANFHAWRSLGYTVSFANSTYLCVSTKLVLCILLVCLALLLYVFVEIQTKVQEYRGLKSRDKIADGNEVPDRDDESGSHDQPGSPSSISTIPLHYLQARKSFDFVELSEIIKEAQSGWTRDKDILKLDLPKVMSREHLQHSKVTTWFHTISVSEEDMISSIGDPHYINQTVFDHRQQYMQRSKSDSNLKSAISQRESDEYANGQLSSRYKSSVSGQTIAIKSLAGQEKSVLMAAITERDNANGSRQKYNNSNAYKRFKESKSAHKRLSLQIPDTNHLNQGSASPRASMARSPSSGYSSEIYSIGTRSPVNSSASDRTSGEGYIHSQFLHRHSLDATALSSVHEDITPSESEPVVTFHIGSASPEEHTSSGLFFNTARPLSSESDPTQNVTSSNNKRGGISKVLSKVTRRYQKSLHSKGVVNAAFSKADEHEGTEVGRDERTDEEQEIDISDVDSDGFVDDDDEEEEVFEDASSPKTHATLSSVIALRKKRPKILSQSEDVSSIY